MKNLIVKKNILSVEVSDTTSGQVLEYIFSLLEQKEGKTSIVTPNPEIVMYARSHEAYRKILNQASIALCDGFGLFLAGKFLGQEVKERISGVDFMENLCKESVRKAVTVGFLGGKDGVAERTAECLSERYPGLKVAFVAEEWLGEASKPQSFKASKKENNSGAGKIDILFVAFGFPKQEVWIAEHLEKLPVSVMMGVGGSFDYLSGDISRAPGIMRSLGLEWLYRLMRQPWRIKRQLVLPKFILVVLFERFKSRA